MIKAGGGSIVNGLLANPIVVRPKWAQYVATKAAVLALTRDHAMHYVRLNSISPGPTITSYHIANRAAHDSTSLAAGEQAMRQAGVRNFFSDAVSRTSLRTAFRCRPATNRHPLPAPTS